MKLKMDVKSIEWWVWTVTLVLIIADLSPPQIVPRLADAGIYLASEATLYRLLREAKLLRHRQRSRPGSSRGPRHHEASGPNRVWSWDISYLPTPVRGLFFYLYLVVHLYSRKIVGWQVHDQESSTAASALLTEACQVEGVAHDQLVLHADNSAPMKGATLLATLQALGVMPSFSRPSVSDDNPFSEALFRTVKYRPWYPERPFASLAEARAWVERFVAWYNLEHHHSGIRFVTPHSATPARITRCSPSATSCTRQHVRVSRCAGVATHAIGRRSARCG